MPRRPYSFILPALLPGPVAAALRQKRSRDRHRPFPVVREDYMEIVQRIEAGEPLRSWEVPANQLRGLLNRGLLRCDPHSCRLEIPR